MGRPSEGLRRNHLDRQTRRGHVPGRVWTAPVLVRLLIATTNLIGSTAKRTIEGQEKQASVLLLGDLEAAEGRLARLPLGVACPTAAAETPTASSAACAINKVVSLG